MTAAVASRVASRIFGAANLTESVTIERQTAGAYNDFGEWVAGAPTTETVDAVVAPIDGRTRDTLPENLRASEARTFWIRGNVNPIRAGESDGDLIVYDTFVFRVVQTQQWGDAFVECLGAAPEDQPTIIPPFDV